MPSTYRAALMRRFWRNVPDRRSMEHLVRYAASPPGYNPSIAPVADMWHRNLVRETGPGNLGVYLVSNCEFYLPKIGAAGTTYSPVPVPGDRINDAIQATAVYTNSVWTVYRVEEVGALGAWKLSCVTPSIAAGFGLAVSIQAPTEVVTDSGLRAISGWTEVSGQTGWLQRTDAEVDGDIQGKRATPRNGTVYVPLAFEVKSQYSVLVSSSRYTIKDVRYPRDFADMMELDVELLE